MSNCQQFRFTSSSFGSADLKISRDLAESLLMALLVLPLIQSCVAGLLQFDEQHPVCS